MAKRRRYLSLTGKKRKETQVQLHARIAKAANTRRARTLAAKQNIAKYTLEHLEPPKQPAAIREQLLKDGLALTMGDRNRSYGDPFINFMLTARMKELFWDAMQASGKAAVQNSPWGHAIDMCFTNLARVATSPTSHLERDRYLDLANYAAIAFEVGTRSEK